MTLALNFLIKLSKTGILINFRPKIINHSISRYPEKKNITVFYPNHFNTLGLFHTAPINVEAAVKKSNKLSHFSERRQKLDLNPETSCLKFLHSGKNF